MILGISIYKKWWINIPEGNEGILGEEDGLSPHSRLGELGEHYARHARLEHTILLISKN